MTLHSLSTLGEVDLFDLEQCGDSGARKHVVDADPKSSVFFTPMQMRDAGRLDHELNQMRFLIFCARHVRRAQEQRDLSALREFRHEIRRISARPETNFCGMLANYLAEQDRRTRPWYQKQRRAARRDGQQRQKAAA